MEVLAVQFHGRLACFALSSESVKCRFSKCRFSVLNLKFDFISDGGRTREKQIQKALGSLSPCGNRCRFSESAICSSRVHPPSEIKSKFKFKTLGRTPSTAGTFRKKFRKNSGKTPETLSERLLEFPSRVRLGCPKPYNSRHLRLRERFPEFSPPQYGWGRLFFQNWFRRGPLRAGHGIPSSTGGISETLRWRPLRWRLTLSDFCAKPACGPCP